jgi:hypothetical protein
MPTQKFKYPLTETERNELITILAAYERIEFRDLANIFDITPPRIDQIIHSTLQRFFPDDERLFYLSAKSAIQEYAKRLLRSQEIAQRFKELRDKEKSLRSREFIVGETVLFAKQNEIVIAVDNQTITLEDGSKVRRSSTTVQKIENKTQLEIPFPRKRKQTKEKK